MMEDRTVPALFSDLVENITTLFRKEVQLAKTELSEKSGEVATAATSLAIGGAVLLGALIILMHAVVAWLVRFGLPPEWSFLLVAAAGGIVGFLVLQGGRAKLRAVNMMPRRTIEQLQRDAAVTKEQVR